MVSCYDQCPDKVCLLECSNNESSSVTIYNALLTNVASPASSAATGGVTCYSLAVTRLDKAGPGYQCDTLLYLTIIQNNIILVRKLLIDEDSPKKANIN